MKPNILPKKRVSVGRGAQKQGHAWERYTRQLLIPDWNGREGQERLQRSKVLVVGVGGSGSALLRHLSQAGIGELRLCDGGVITLEDMNRFALGDERDLGKKRAIVAGAALKRLHVGMEVQIHPHNLNESTIEELASGCDLICCATDDRGAKRLLNAYSVRTALPIVYAGGHFMGGFVTFVQPPQTPCLECLMQASDRNREAMRRGEIPEDEEAFILEQGNNPILGAADGLAGSLQALEAIKYLLGINGNLMGIMLIFRAGGLGMSFEQYDLDMLRDPSCPFCAPESSE